MSIPGILFCNTLSFPKHILTTTRIFNKTTSIFNCVSIAKHEPYRYDKEGNVLIDYADTDEHARRKSSVAYTEGTGARRLSRVSGTGSQDGGTSQQEKVGEV